MSALYYHKISAIILHTLLNFRKKGRPIVLVVVYKYKFNLKL